MQKEKSIYSKTIEEIETSLFADRNKGLSFDDVKKRLEKNGENRLEEERNISMWRIFIRQFKSIVMLLLMAAAIASFFIGEIIEGFAVLVVILFTAILGLIMEYKAGKSIEALKKSVHREAKVIRNGEVSSISTRNLVCGDLVVLEEGDKIPADGRLVKTDELAVDESMLTGESDPVKKDIEVIDRDEKVDIGDCDNMVFMGSAVLKGNGKFIVTATGNDAEIGKISKMLKDTDTEATPLEKRLEQTGRYLIVLTLVITGIVGVIGYFTGKPLEEMLKTSTALAIAAVPEGLPVAATITLAIGMNRMVKKKALVKNLPAVETLGSATVFCTDKTGTLTENEMTLQRISIDNRDINITGTGYKPEGEFRENEEKINPNQDDAVSLLLKTGILCSDAVLKEKADDEWEMIGDPTEGALVVAARKAGFKKQDLEEVYDRQDEIPFDSERKFMAVHYKDLKNNNNELFLKGSPDVVLEMCDKVYQDNKVVSLSQERKQELKSENKHLAKESFRVLALAYKGEEVNNDGALESEIENEMIFLGLVGIMDPPREDIKESVEIASKAGIRTIMLTGDQQETAIGIAKNIGIEFNEKKLLKDTAISDLSTESLEENLKENSIYSKVTPKDKLSIVTALKNSNEIVAMTGDGVNDAPALKKADIGVAMGIRGTTVAKEASDMILLNDRFSTIVEAVRQGRVIFDNIRKFIHYLISCNLSEILFIFLSIIFRVPVPLIALQILWLNVVTGVFPALAMAYEVPEKGVMSNSPRNPDDPIITNRYKSLITSQGFIIAIGPLIAYLLSLHQGIDISEARTIGFMTLAMVHLLQVFNVRRKNGLGFDKTIFQNPYLIGALALTFALQIVAIYTPMLQKILGTVGLSLYMWAYVVIGALIPMIIIQANAIIQMKRRK
ncbi:cation-translocating P-type ATPase [Haloplasma contractile]|uniref:Cation-transporting ATPase protein n=1 Tax=Haloplasma contractile SSD-17B TaxID=1033810 RepID=U2E947_9MOLU|nr:cation-transporting P-type ATPase [Haloplasma contractile]ERJ11396.1 Cation-transporting ATPase protein [Haloplasma contractile SSD-17B]